MTLITDGDCLLSLYEFWSRFYGLQCLEVRTRVVGTFSVKKSYYIFTSVRFPSLRITVLLRIDASY